ncbi:hypothetical protein OIU79_012055 [Salix purpurea]|uniref:Uncharacterized protein n=1 Tax=Salix purpurea TaxID=77065 RepID=A0A9Q0Q291_SALPP|nr:hypothetical protein OIU79_012055 [Salix purpurea]
MAFKKTLGGAMFYHYAASVLMELMHGRSGRRKWLASGNTNLEFRVTVLSNVECYYSAGEFRKSLLAEFNRKCWSSILLTCLILYSHPHYSSLFLVIVRTSIDYWDSMLWAQCISLDLIVVFLFIIFLCSDHFEMYLHII